MCIYMSMCVAICCLLISLKIFFIHFVLYIIRVGIFIESHLYYEKQSNNSLVKNYIISKLEVVLDSLSSPMAGVI